MKKITALILTLTLVLALASCGESTVSETTENELTKITFCLDWTPNTNHTGIYAAKALGYYEEAGIDLEIVQPPEDGASLMCGVGQAQFAIDAQDVLAANFVSDSPLGVTAVAAIINHNTSGVIARAGEGIATPKGLENKRYSTWDSPIELAMLNNVVAADGGDFSKVELIPNTITDEAAALAENQTDAIWIFYGWGGINAELSGLDFDYWNFKDIDPVFDYYTPLIIANNDFLESDPETAKAFLEATKKGYEYAIENPAEAAELLIAGDNTGSLAGSEELVKASQEWISKQYVADGESWGYIDGERWDAFYGWLYENNLIANEIPKGFGYSNDYISY